MNRMPRVVVVRRDSLFALILYGSMPELRTARKRMLANMGQVTGVGENQVNFALAVCLT